MPRPLPSTSVNGRGPFMTVQMVRVSNLPLWSRTKMADDLEWCIVIAPFKEMATEVRYSPGNTLRLEPERMRRWIKQGLVKEIGWEGADMSSWPWGGVPGRDLTVLDTPGDWKRIVACLNIWQDLVALQKSYLTWYPHVDHVIAVDGAYWNFKELVPHAYSDDGTLEFLQSLDKVQLVHCSDFWRNQCEKRTTYFQLSKPGDLLFIVDADEYVTGAENLRATPDLDVGWVQYSNPLYTRRQGFPRVFRGGQDYRYEGRHHWIYDWENQGALVTTAQEGGQVEHRLLPIHIENSRGSKRPWPRRQVDIDSRALQVKTEAQIGDAQVGGREPLRVLQLATLDAGMVVYRLHSAINTTTPHESIMGTRDHDRPYQEPWQFDLGADQDTLRRALATTDVLHCHLNYLERDILGWRKNAQVVIHHHGTMFRENPKATNARDEVNAAVRLVSNLELLQYGDNLHYLPNPVPVTRYLKLAEQVRPLAGEGIVRIAHSPSKRHFKGTEDFLEVISILHGKGVPVKGVLIEKTSHQESLSLRATCDISFDSFFLGMQCSGLEGAAMGQPVIAGDAHVKAEYEKRYGHCPYTFAADKKELEEQIVLLVTNPGYFETEALRVYNHVKKYHDYSAVAISYLDILDSALQWRTKLSLGIFKGPLGTK